ncbi:MAG: chorismate-binding protein [Nostocaceae cyanobacterium]|nr:chorismate-binding protein [Nostocaceae cyanobacterium]
MVFDLFSVIQPWYWRSLPLEKRTGSDIFAALFLDNSGSKIATLLESPYPAPKDNPQLSRYSICAGNPRYVDGHPQMWTPPLGEVLPFLEELTQRKPSPPTPGRGNPTGHKDCTPGGHEDCAPVGHKDCTPGGHEDCTPVGYEDCTPVGHEDYTPVGRKHCAPTVPFTGGWLGWLGYDIAWEIERLPLTKSDTLPFPVAFWYEPENFAVLDHQEQLLWLAASSIQGLDELENRLEKGQEGQQPTPGGGNAFGRKHCAPTVPISHSSPSPPSPLSSPSPHFFTSQTDYETAVNQAKKYIQAGDIFQANLSLRFAAPTAASGWDIYQALQQINPSPFASYWQTPWGEIVSCSPERLVKLDRGLAETRPIAGTRTRGTTPQKDQELADELVNNPKERAEHIMLVDLERNDLGRVCEWGSVSVDELLTIERYSHVMHLVSNVKGTLKSNISVVDLIRAMFPGGTITGCPKVRCMEIIEELEPTRRSLFYGSCGYLDWRGNLDLNIFIRTLLLTPIPETEVESELGKVIINTKKHQKSLKDFSTEALSTPTPSVNTPCYDSESSQGSFSLDDSRGGEFLGCSTFQPSSQVNSPPTSSSAVPQASSRFNIVWGQVGAGIVADSDPKREWYESLHKAQAQLKALAKVLSKLKPFPYHKLNPKGRVV